MPRSTSVYIALIANFASAVIVGLLFNSILLGSILFIGALFLLGSVTIFVNRQDPEKKLIELINNASFTFGAGIILTLIVFVIFGFSPNTKNPSFIPCSRVVCYNGAHWSEWQTATALILNPSTATNTLTFTPSSTTPTFTSTSTPTLTLTSSPTLTPTPTFTPTATTMPGWIFCPNKKVSITLYIHDGPWFGPKYKGYILKGTTCPTFYKLSEDLEGQKWMELVPDQNIKEIIWGYDSIDHTGWVNAEYLDPKGGYSADDLPTEQFFPKPTVTLTPQG